MHNVLKLRVTDACERGIRGLPVRSTTVKRAASAGSLFDEFD